MSFKKMFQKPSEKENRIAHQAKVAAGAGTGTGRDREQNR